MKNNKSAKIGGVLLGLILVVVGMILLWFNEGRTVKTTQTIKEAKEQYVDVDSSNIDINNNGKLIATQGEMVIPSLGVNDTEFNLHVNTAKLKRKVEMYQWEETCDTDDNDNQNCTYKQVWDEKIINSNNFENSSYINPNTMLYESETYIAQNVKVGEYELNDTLLNQLSTSKKVILANNDEITKEGFKVSGNYYTNSQSNTPQIGDIRISYTYSDATSVSILAVQNNNKFEKFISSVNYEIYELQEGTKNGQEILNNLTNENNMVKWFLRIGGTILIITGMFLIISPLQRLASFIPILGTIFNWITGFAVVILGIGISLITIAIAWFRYRPVLSICLIVIALILIFAMKKIKKGKINLSPSDTNVNNAQMPNNYTNDTSNSNFQNDINNLNEKNDFK